MAGSDVSIGDIKKLIPPHCFEKVLWKSLAYMFRDLVLLTTALWTYSYLPLLLFWNVYGFIMWCVFVVGHDCGHESFSEYPLINAICGHLCHTILCVPYWPWQYSHWKHHIHHNHHKKDRGHWWVTETEHNQETKCNQMLYTSPLVPFAAYFLYLYLGYSDGSHISPFSSLYKHEKTGNQRLKCLLSVGILVVFLIIVFGVIKVELYTFAVYYVPSWIVFSFWLFMVTYMQHHKREGTAIFDNESWAFITGALETIDRSYGYGIDDFHHNISDCHLIHHLFFSKIPHYYLKDATNSVKQYLLSKGVYNCRTHRLVWFDFWALFLKRHFIGILA